MVSFPRVGMENRVLTALVVTVAGSIVGCGGETPDSAAPSAATLEAGCKHTRFAGDDLCIAPPPPDQGYVGPDHSLTVAAKYLNDRAGSIYAGTNEIQRNIMSKAILGL